MKTAAAAVFAAFCFSAAGGPLVPPAGPVGSTAKPIAEVEPRMAISTANTPGDANSRFRITQPGSYYLTGNITATATLSAIEVNSPGVTIDLNGFEITGAGPSATLDGIVIDPIDTNGTTVVRNGAIRACRNGISASLYGHVVLERVAISRSTQAGANVTHATVRDCQFLANGGAGLAIFGVATVTGSTALGNSSHGFSTFNAGSSFAGCIARLNGANGFDAAGSTITDSLAESNGAIGIRSPQVLSNSRVSGGTAPLQLSGGVATNCVIEGGSGNGVTLSAGAVLQDCRVSGAAQHGVVIGSSGTRCTVTRCSIATCGSAAGAWGGIYVEGTDNTISDNRVSDMNTGGDDVGVWVTAVGNCVVRNNASACNDFFNIVAGNAAGPEIGASGVATNTNPNANIGF